MRLMRATVFAVTACIPSFLLGLFAYWLMGGNLHSDNPDDFMYIPCYGPFFGSIAVGVWLGMRNEQDVELET